MFPSQKTHTRSSESQKTISVPKPAVTDFKTWQTFRRNGGRRTGLLECATLPCSPVNARALLLVIPALSDTDFPASPHLADVQRSNFNSVLKAMSTESTSRRPSTPTSRRSTYITYDRGQWSYQTPTHQVRAAGRLSPHRTALHASQIHSPSPSALRALMSAFTRCATVAE